MALNSGPKHRRAAEFARIAIEQYGLWDARFRPLQGAKTKRIRQLFFVSSARGNFLLRMYDPLPIEGETRVDRHLAAKLRSEAAIRSQMLWLADLRRDMRLPVPEPVPTLHGSLAGCAAGGGTFRSFALLRWIPGEVRAYDLTPADAYAFGSYIASLHRHAEKYSVPEGFVRPRWDADYLLGGSAQQWDLGERFLPKRQIETAVYASDRIRETCEEIGEPRNAFGIIHSDLHGENLVFHQGVMYAIDFDQCGWGYYMYDLALAYMALGQYRDSSELMQNALLEGYQRVRPLPNNYLKILETFVSLRHLARMHEIFAALSDLPLEDITAHPKWKRVERAMAGLGRFSKSN